MLESDQKFIQWIQDHNDWYEKQSSKWGKILSLCKWLTLVSSFISIVIAAAATKDFFAVWGKILLVAATLLSAAASELLGQFRVRQMEDLRESGNLETAHLLAYARDKFEEFADDRAKVHKIKDEIRERMRVLEQAQHRQFVDINLSGGAPGSPGSAPRESTAHV